MNNISKCKFIVRHPEYLIGVILRKTFVGMWLNDKAFVKWDFFSGMRKFPDLDNPRSFNEKLQWLKLNDHNTKYTQMVDKAAAKDYIKQQIGEEYLIPTLGVWDSFDEIDFDALPNQFVLKTTHDSGGIVIVKDKTKIDVDDVKRKIEKSLKREFYFEHREYPYKNVRPRILAERYMVDESGTELKDYKFFCFDGEVKFFKVDFNREINHRANYYSPNMELLPFGETLCPPDIGHIVKRPLNLDKMIEIARTLSQSIPFLRVDLYNINGIIYFGELTFYPSSGSGQITPVEWDYKIGEWISLPRNSDVY